MRARPREPGLIQTRGDDFGQRVRMSATQFADLVTEARVGRLDVVTTA
ncbi:hypothetical protein [Streptomyces sp. NBC_01363]|nr:hypothetical protein [Streptomyces sp. NBC_01363]MCX4731118.1 hypothetical protein [Streptomyces sp. NBC_01363]